MNWIEVIQIRISGNSHKILEKQLIHLMKEVNLTTDDQLVVYKQLNLETDVSIHLYHKSQKIESNGSALGLRLVSSLKEYGLINHSGWKEIE